MFYRRDMYVLSVQALEFQGNPKPATSNKVPDSLSAQLPDFQISWKTFTHFALQPQRTHFNISKQSHWRDSYLSPLAGINSKNHSPQQTLFMHSFQSPHFSWPFYTSHLWEEPLSEMLKSWVTSFQLFPLQNWCLLVSQLILVLNTFLHALVKHSSWI